MTVHDSAWNANSKFMTVFSVWWLHCLCKICPPPWWQTPTRA